MSHFIDLKKSQIKWFCDDIKFRNSHQNPTKEENRNVNIQLYSYKASMVYNPIISTQSMDIWLDQPRFEFAR